MEQVDCSCFIQKLKPICSICIFLRSQNLYPAQLIDLCIILIWLGTTLLTLLLSAFTILPVKLFTACAMLMHINILFNNQALITITCFKFKIMSRLSS